MNANLPASISDLWSLAGWTMIHFLWLGTIVAVVALVVRTLLRHASSSVRYVTALAFLLALAALPFATAAWLMNFAPPLKGGAGGAMTASAPQEPAALPTPDNQLIELHTTEPSNQFAGVDSLVPPAAPGSAGGSPRSSASSSAAELPSAPGSPRQSRGLLDSLSSLTITAFLNRLDGCIAYLPWLWLVGTPLTFALLISGVVGTRRLGRASRVIDDGPIAELRAQLTASLRISHRVTVAVCERIAAPVLIGIVRPMILLPPAAVTGWSPDEIEMVLLHELAHVRRWDNLVNLLQRCIESLLFFHPAVWFISGWARHEREACCDAVVVTRTNRPHAYAELLVACAVRLSDFSSEPGRPRPRPFLRGRGRPGSLPVHSAMAAGPLRFRIRRILQLEEDPMLISGKSFAIVFASLLAAATLAVLYLPKVGQAEQSTTEVTENAEKKQEKSEAKATSEPTPDPETKPLILGLKRSRSGQSTLYLNDQPIDQDQLRAAILRDEKQLNDLLVSLDADKGVSYRDVMKVVDLLESLGVKKLALDTRQVQATTDSEKSADDRSEDALKLLKTFGIDPSKESAATDTANIVELFNVAAANPMVSAGYTVSPQQRKTLEAAFDAIRSGPLGKQVKFENEWDEHHSWVIVTAPKLALNGFFGPLVDALRGPATIPGNESLRARWLEQAKLAEKSRVEMSPSNGQDRPADDWPMGVAFPSPKEGEIATRAWRTLGIKLVPMTAEDHRSGQFTGDIKVIDGFPSKPQKTWTIFVLQAIGKHPAKTFDEVALALDDLKSNPGNVEIKCQMYREPERPNATSQPPLEMSFLASPRRSDSKPEPAAANKAKFPSLEEQKLADLVWKGLGFEVEALGADDLKRVQALGYEGGVRVAMAPHQTSFGRGGISEGTIGVGDILVGLHVWPTTSLQDVAQVLGRSDIDALNPLKFYVVRQMTQSFTDAPPKTHDTVQTGRITVIATPIATAPTANQPYPTGPTPASPAPQRAIPTMPQQGNWANRPAEPALGAASPNHAVTRDEWNSAPQPPPVVSVPNIATTDSDRASNPYAVPHPVDDVPLQVPVLDDSSASDDSQSPQLKPRQLALAARDFEHFVIFFYSPRAQESLGLKPFLAQFKELKKEFPANSLGAAIVNVTDDREIADVYNIKSVPAYAVFHNGERIKLSTGLRTIAELLADLKFAKPTVSPEEIGVLRDRVKTIEDQFKYTSERVKAGKGATEIDLKHVSCDLALAQSELALGEGQRDEAVKKLEEARALAEEMIKIRQASARAGLDSPDIEEILKANRTLSDIKLKLIRLKNRPMPMPEQGWNSGPRPATSTNSDSFTEPRSPFVVTADDGVASPTVLRQRTAADSKTVIESVPVGQPTPAPGSVSPAASDSLNSSTALADSPLRPNPQPSYSNSLHEPADETLRPARDSKNTEQGGTNERSLLTRGKGAISGPANVTNNAPVSPRDVWLRENRPIPIAATVANSSPAATTNRSDANSDLSRLRYDDKTFDEWRNSLISELSSNKRLEAVNALAAFARAGYGKEAVDVILDIVPQYDFRDAFSDSNPEGKLTRGILEAFKRTIPMQDWLPSLRRRFDADPTKWTAFADEVVTASSSPDAAARTQRQKFLVALATPDGQGRGGSSRALVALVNTDPKLTNPEIKGLVLKQLRSDARLADVILALCSGAAVPPELIEIVLHGDETKQVVARSALERCGPGYFTTTIVKAMTDVLQDKSRQKDDLAAIRTLAALGSSARGPGIEKLLDEILKSADQAEKIAAACALERISNGSFQAGEIVRAHIDINDKNAADISAALEAEKQAILGRKW